ncbi:hypothetical protein [Labedaea rhizosphaerae]|uniref:Arylsulfotransferase ASST n=1 Tax=Labedaea rhizosphaerae TaxID=598644 RepID=A0A4R6RXQ0_LABRH|nr:hypothetical protein [Labedaea rhizosphaerae]TDP91851.1 hypothetical protein EV186_10861 [Labedaea rhizosphaerae]
MQEVKRESVAWAARTLAWIEGHLYDVVSGWTPIPLADPGKPARIGHFGDQFDSVSVAPEGDLVALVAGPGTKGLLLDPLGFVEREVNRSYYQAEAYRYPLALFTLPDGQTGVVHCPHDYNRLEIEVAATGECLTVAEREPDDFFHSRLAVSSSGRYLLSAGWIWQPFDCLAVYDLHRALDEPGTLDDTSGGVVDLERFHSADISGACFVGDDLVVSSADEPSDPGEPGNLGKGSLARYSMEERRFTWQVRLPEPAGDLIPLGEHVLAVHKHPRLYDAANGDLLAEWPDLPTGDAITSIVWAETFAGPARVAVDGTRFAHTDGERVTVVDLQA